MKKLENFVKKKEQVDAWLKKASPEDAEYYLCQQELGQELLESCTAVERIIGNSFSIGKIIKKNT